MDPIPPEAFLAGYPGPMREIAERLRSIVRRAVPDALERVRPGWRLIGYDLPTDRGKSVYVCYVAPEPAHVHLGFEHGVLMRDPDGLLLGRGITRKVRWLTVRAGESIPAHQYRTLVLEAARVARMSREERIALALDEST